MSIIEREMFVTFLQVTLLDAIELILIPELIPFLKSNPDSYSGANCDSQVESDCGVNSDTVSNRIDSSIGFGSGIESELQFKGPIPSSHH